MLIVSDCVSPTNTNCNGTSSLEDLADDVGELGSAARLPTGFVSPPQLCECISGLEQLSALGVGFYPINPDKSPAVKGKLAREVTSDPRKIAFWTASQQHRNFATRIPARSKLIVIDTESPFKHGDVGPDGELIFCELLEEHSITLPSCPTVQTPTGGFHRYLLTPKGIQIHAAIALWPGVDILAVGSNVILPGSHTDAGRYRILRSFGEHGIPEAPREFARLIRKAERKRTAGGKGRAAGSVPAGDSSLVSPREWFLLRRNAVFRSFWHRAGKESDPSDSAYEYHLAKACFCCGLNRWQVAHVIRTWWRMHELIRSQEKLERAIIPAAWNEVEAWVTAWHAQQASAAEMRRSGKAASRILSQIATAGPQTPASIAAALPIARERAKKAMQRMAARGELVRTNSGYTIASPVGTF